MTRILRLFTYLSRVIAEGYQGLLKLQLLRYDGNHVAEVLQLNHLEIIFAYAAVRAHPIVRNIFPGGARRDAVFW